MKKLLLTILAIISIHLGTFAYNQINYNSAGGVTSTTYTVPTPYGAQTYIDNFAGGTINNYGSNALFQPNTIHKIAEEQRRIQNEKTYLENTRNINVNINHSGFSPYRYNNGYRNYNNTYYPTYRGVRYNNRGLNGINTRGIILY